MFTKAAIIVAFFNAFVWGYVHQIDRDISQKTAQVQELNTEIEAAKKTFGLVDTQEYVEKIGLTAQLNGQIADLEEERSKYVNQLKTP